MTDVYRITYLITMDIGFKMLTDGMLTVDEFRKYLDRKSHKYDCEDIQALYQSKLDVFLEQSVNGDTKKESIDGNH